MKKLAILLFVVLMAVPTPLYAEVPIAPPVQSFAPTDASVELGATEQFLTQKGIDAWNDSHNGAGGGLQTRMFADIVANEGDVVRVDCGVGSNGIMRVAVDPGDYTLTSIETTDLDRHKIYDIAFNSDSKITFMCIVVGDAYIFIPPKVNARITVGDEELSVTHYAYNSLWRLMLPLISRAWSG